MPKNTINPRSLPVRSRPEASSTPTQAESSASAAVRRAPADTDLQSTRTSRGGLPPRKVQLTPARAESNLAQARDRLAAFFGEPPAGVRARDLQEATTQIDDYLAHSGASVPQDVRSFMIQMLSRMPEVDRALPYGRGNVLVRPETGATPDYAATFEKSRLKYLGELCHEAMAPPSGFERRPIQTTTKAAAAGLLLGTGACVNYVHLFVLKMGLMLDQKPELKDKVKVSIQSRPYVGDSRIDHVYGTATFTDDAGKQHDIAFDPFGDEDRVQLAAHSPYKSPIMNDVATQVKSINASTAELVGSHMQVAHDHMPAQLASQKYERETGVTESQSQATPAENRFFTMSDSLAGYVDAPVRNADTPPAPGELVRRRTLARAEDSPLLAQD